MKRRSVDVTLKDSRTPGEFTQLEATLILGAVRTTLAGNLHPFEAMT